MNPPPTRARSQRKIKNFLIDGEFQLRYVAQMVAVSAGLTAGLGWMVYRFNAEASRVVALRALDPADELAAQLQEEFARGSRNLVLALLAFGVVLSLVLAAWQIVTTHKVAGPLYYISHQVRRIRDGYLGQLHPLRKGDMLHAFFETFREMHAALRDRAAMESTRFGQLADRCEAAGLHDVAEELRQLKAQRDGSLQ